MSKPVFNGEAHKLANERATNILHRTPWRPPIAISAKGSEIILEDGKVLLDAVVCTSQFMVLNRLNFWRAAPLSLVLEWGIRMSLRQFKIKSRAWPV
jgi:hypothetical protein